MEEVRSPVLDADKNLCCMKPLLNELTNPVSKAYRLRTDEFSSPTIYLSKLNFLRTPEIAAPQEEASPIDALPTALLLSVLLRLPLVDRVRATLVSKIWATFLTQPAFWADLSFEGARAEHLDDGTILQLCERARGQLRSLDVAWAAERRFSHSPPGLPLLSNLAEAGLAARLQSLTTAPSSWLIIETEAEAQQLRAACPALAKASIVIDCCPWVEFPAIARALAPLRSGGSLVRLRLRGAGGADAAAGLDGATGGFAAAFADALSEALPLCPTDTLELYPPPSDDDDDGDGDGDAHLGFASRFAASAAACAEAAQRLAEALASPPAHPGADRRGGSVRLPWVLPRARRRRPCARAPVPRPHRRVKAHRALDLLRPERRRRRRRGSCSGEGR